MGRDVNVTGESYGEFTKEMTKQSADMFLAGMYVPYIADGMLNQSDTTYYNVNLCQGLRPKHWVGLNYRASPGSDLHRSPITPSE